MKSFIILLFSLSTTFTQNRAHKGVAHDTLPSVINWAETKEWKLYYLHSKKAFSYPLDTLNNFSSIPLNEDSMKVFLQTVTEIPVERIPVWMGYYVASCRLPDNKHIKIEISQYGRFFYEEKEKRYFQLDEHLQANWLAYLAAKWRVLEDASK